MEDTSSLHRAGRRFGMTKFASALLRGSPEELQRWVENPDAKRVKFFVCAIILGFGSYGLTTGLWRAPQMGIYVAVKMPLLIGFVLACNGLLNGMLGLLLGSGLGFRQSVLAQLVSFSIAAIVLGALAPVTFFMALNAPEATAPNASIAHANFLVAHTFLIACAGIIANIHLARLLVATTPSRTVAGATLLSWLSGNAFVGAQLSWILRPFFGTPSIEVQFLRENPFDGTFYEVMWASMNRAAGGGAVYVLFFLISVLIVLHLPVVKFFFQPIKNDE